MTMTLLAAMHAYFRGEKLEAYFFILPIGIALIGFAWIAWRVERPAFALAVAIPCALFGLVAIATGLSVGTRTESQVAALEQVLETDAQTLVADELPRMQRVNALFGWYLKGYVALTLLGLVLRFALRADWAHGAGSAFLLVAGLGFMIDGFAERRARPYTAALEQLADGVKARPADDAKAEQR